ncbi:MAG: hypothetical protein V3U59_02430 [Gammaproteobacteria bacterium]
MGQLEPGAFDARQRVEVVTHVLEPATSGRAKCRGCNQPIQKDILRLGERLPNPYGDGEMTLWYHPICAAYKRPEPLLEALQATSEGLDDADNLVSITERGIKHRRLPRVHKAEPAPTGRARCRCCKELIPKDSWRISVVYFEEGRFQPSGFVHASCAEQYFGTTDDLVQRVQHFGGNMEAAMIKELRDALD